MRIACGLSMWQCARAHHSKSELSASNTANSTMKWIAFFLFFFLFHFTSYARRLWSTLRIRFFTLLFVHSLSLCCFVAFVSFDFLSVLQRPSSFVLKWQRQRRTETRFCLCRSDRGAKTEKRQKNQIHYRSALKKWRNERKQHKKYNCILMA